MREMEYCSGVRLLSVKTLVKTIGKPTVQSSSYVFAAIAKTIAPASIDGREAAFKRFLIRSNNFGFAFSGTEREIPFLKRKKSLIFMTAIIRAIMPAILVIVFSWPACRKRFSHADMT